MSKRRSKEVVRCPWARSPLLAAYHDAEWGVPLTDDRRMFEFLILDGAQAGLSWETVLRKRENYRKALDQFDAEKIARYGKRKIDSLLADPGIIRNRLKIASAVDNARAYLELTAEAGSFSAFLWQFVEGKTRQNRFRSIDQLPSKTAESEAMSRALKNRGFRFVGPTICYALMQSAGMVNDHLVSCFRHHELSKTGR
jgi:DNA-3-methyladenine glycosylase I